MNVSTIYIFFLKDARLEIIPKSVLLKSKLQA